jgi:hypothetical protein
MSSLNDTIALGLVLVLLFGAAALYLYTRVQQCEQKLNLVESILLDIKMGAELREYPDLGLQKQQPSHPSTQSHPSIQSQPNPLEEEALYSAALEEAAIDSIEALPKEESDEKQEKQVTVAATGSGKAKSPAPIVTKQAQTQAASVTVNYEAMTLVELKELGRQRSIKGFSTMRRSQILEALRSHDASPDAGVPSKLNEEILSSLLEQASSFTEAESLEGGETLSSE